MDDRLRWRETIAWPYSGTFLLLQRGARSIQPWILGPGQGEGQHGCRLDQ